MVLTTAELNEMEDLVHDLEILHEALPMYIFMMKIGLHQGRAQLRTEEDVTAMLAEVALLDVDVHAL